MRGFFVPGITAEEFRNGCLESVEALRAKGVIYDVDIPAIENKKTVKNDELVEIKNLAPGTIVEFGGILQWEILDNHFSTALLNEGVFCLARDAIFNQAFDEKNCNNWRISTLRDYLNGDFKNNITAKICGNMLLPFERDLTSDDGLKDYGKCIDYISLISCNEYRKYRHYINNKSGWWWTLTGWSTLRSSFSHYVQFVNTNGLLGEDIALKEHAAVVPVLCVYPTLKVKVVSDFYKSDQ